MDFLQEILLWLILYFWEIGCQLYPELLTIDTYGLFQLACPGGTYPQHSNILFAFRRPHVEMEHSLAFLIKYDRHTLQQ